MEESVKFSEKLITIVMKFVNMKGVIALKDGIMYTLPLTLVGSIFLLLAQIPYKPFNDWVTSFLGESWTDPLWQVFGSTFSIIAIIACMGMAYIYARNDGHEPFAASVMSFVAFLIINKSSLVTAKGETVSGIIDKNWTGGQGMVTAIIVGLIVGAIYSWFLEKKFVINMPAGVPQGVANQFTALIPAAVIFTGSMIIYTFFKFVMNTTFIEVIFKVLQTPLQGATDSLPGAIMAGALIPFFWWFGVHGGAIVGGVMGPLWGANGLANQAILDKGQELTIANGAHIVTQQFVDQFLTVTGSGLTIGLVIAMILVGKSAQSKTLGKIALTPTLFNINEPVIFGFPIVMNPFMFIPFVAVPTISSIITYFAFKIGFLHPFSAVSVPWTTPPIISGFILQGWQGALWQLIIIVISVIVYVPFLKKQDSINLKQEQEVV
ncbi:permease IIC component [Clostridium gelidum]|uniref:Permease IIC component n=1 Tax=Clostridium gelidum TaxID=704125 RepID=A0ABN6IYZ1_9CLOT|nr:PTS sugar transporter subunit IIC [Clostridium gelidum]BCZ47355.1 permease IIC component [Clostridium gelidum]